MGTFLNYHKNLNALLDSISEIDAALEAENIKEEEKKALTAERKKAEKEYKQLQSDALEAISVGITEVNCMYFLKCLAALGVNNLQTKMQLAQTAYDEACTDFNNVKKQDDLIGAFQKREDAEKALAEAKKEYDDYSAEYAEEFGTTPPTTATGNKTATATRGSRAAMLGYMQKHGTEGFSANELSKVEEVVSQYTTATPAASIARDLADFLKAGKVKVVGTTDRGGRIFQAV